MSANVRLRLVQATLFVIACGFVVEVGRAVPARLPYEPPIAESTKVELAESEWEGSLFGPGAFITFHADGRLTYHSGKGVGREKNSFGTWQIEGDRLHFSVNNYSEYQTILRGDVIEGIGWNKDGQRCNPKLHRVKR